MLFRIWTAKDDSSTRRGPRPLWHLAAGHGVGEGLVSDTEHHFFPSLNLPEIDVLNGVVRLGHGPFSARAVDLRRFQRCDDLLLGACVALHLGERLGEELAGVIPLDGIDIGLLAGSL